MTQPVFEITMRVPVAEGDVRTLVFRSDRGVQDFPGWFFERGTSGEKAFPASSPRPLGEAGTGNPPPAPPSLAGEERCSPIPLVVGVGSRTSAKEHNLNDELRNVRSYQRELMAEFSDLQDCLAPGDSEQARLNDRLADTHAGGWDFSQQAKQARAGMFERSLQLCVRDGRGRIRRRDVNSARKATAREVERLEREIEKQSEKRRRRAT